MSHGASPYQCEQTGSCTIISLLPELNEAQWADFERVGNDLISRLNAAQSPTFLVDLTSLSYMGSAMVALIVRLWKSTKERKGSMVIVNRHEQVMEVLKLAGLTKLWTIVDSREKGLAELGVSGGVFSGASGGIGLLVLGCVAVMGAVAGLGLQFSDSGLGGKIAQVVEFGFAALGLVVGTLLLVREGSTMRRNVGIFVLVVCVLVVLTGIIAAPAPAIPVPAPAATNAGGAALTPPAKQDVSPAGAAAAAPEKGTKRDKEDDDASAAAGTVAGKSGETAPAKEASSPSGAGKAAETAAPAGKLKFGANEDK